jgi:4-hydroxysphinganine ceramide fatty acyl 2-hydroxylase
MALILLHISQPVMERKHVNESGRIFRSPVLEALTRTHIAYPLSIFTSIAVWGAWFGLHRADLGAGSVAVLMLGGALFFTWVEYTVHRWFYHMRTDGPRKARIQYVFHGVHHEHPRDRRRLALPPWMSVLVAMGFVALFRLVLGPMGVVFGGGFLLGYAIYLSIHYAIHVYPAPRNVLGVLWKHHNLHHFVGDTAAFGVSSPLWDLVHGTMPTERRASGMA